MEIYVIIIVALGFQFLFITNRKRFTRIIAFELFLILALRADNLGVDLTNYKAGYEYIRNLEFRDLFSRLRFIQTAKLIHRFRYESGYALLCWMVGNLGISFHGFLIICAAINMYGFESFISKYSKNPFISYLIFLGLGIYVRSFGILRQQLSVSILLLTVQWMFEEKYRRAIIGIILSFLIHRASLLIVLLFLLRRVQITRRLFGFLALAEIAIYGASLFLYNGFVSTILDALGHYKYTSASLRINNLMLLLIGIGVIVYFFTDIEKNDKVLNMALWAYFLATAYEIFGMYNDVFARGIEYYLVFLMILIPNEVEDYPVENTRKSMTIILYILLGSYWIISLNGTVIVPYRLYKWW